MRYDSAVASLQRLDIQLLYRYTDGCYLCCAFIDRSGAFSKWRYVFAVIVGVVIAKVSCFSSGYFGLLNTPGLNLQHLLATRIYHQPQSFHCWYHQYFDAFIFWGNSFP